MEREITAALPTEQQYTRRSAIVRCIPVKDLRFMWQMHTGGQSPPLTLSDWHFQVVARWDEFEDAIFRWLEKAKR